MCNFTIKENITKRDQRTLKAYYNEVKKYPLITADEEAMLSQRIKDGDTEALEKLVNSNLRFVISVAKQYEGYGVDLIDLINEGNVGLITAAKKFDATRGFKFISYAIWWIRQNIQKALASSARTIRLPSNQITLICNIKKTMARFEQTNMREPTPEELSSIMSIPVEKINTAMAASQDTASLNAQAYDDNSGTELLETIADNHTERPDQILMQESLKSDIGIAMSVLNDTEKAVINGLFGLNGQSEQSVNMLALANKITPERVRQIRDHALERMRNTSFAKTLTEYL